MTGLFDVDPTLHRLERVSLGFCVVVAVLSWAVRRGNPDVAIGVLGGGLLLAVSYWAIRSSVSALLLGMAGRGSVLVRLVGRYALLSFLAYVMIARFRLHPVGLLLGASSLFAAAVVEAARVTRDGARKRRA